MIDVAIDAAKQAGQLAYSYIKKIKTVSYKADSSPVTIADQETEKLIRKIITKKFPEHGIIGEELPPINPEAKYQWIIDPIDGTRDYVRKIPHWEVLIALLENNIPIIGVAYFPELDEVFSAQKGKGTYKNNEKMHVSKTKNLNEAYMSFSSIKRFKKVNKTPQLLNICHSTAYPRSFGNLGLKYLLEGKIDINLEAYGAIYDFAVPSILVKEAGGRFTDFSGKNSFTSGTAVSTNGLLHDKVIKLLKN